ncbi:MAG: hypothetical protein HY314_03070 [Acidobacteria bacterium]|nr:hypothetical protein [Acidobacteriota bacterium]
MTEKVSDREKLNWEVQALSDDQVREVLEYISIMKSLQDQDASSRAFNIGGMKKISQRGGSHSSSSFSGQEGSVVAFPHPPRAASK